MSNDFIGYLPEDAALDKAMSERGDEWIKCEDQWPPIGTPVLAWMRQGMSDGYARVVTRWSAKGANGWWNRYESVGGQTLSIPPDYWQPIEPPQ